MRTKAQILASETGLANGDDYEAMRLAVVANQTAATNAVSIMWPAADEAAMLALASAKKGHFAKRNDVQSGYKWIYILNQLPASTLENWSPFAIWYTETTGGGTLDFTALAKCGEYASNNETPFPTTGGTGESGAIKAGNTFINTGSYWIGRAMLIAKIDTPGQNADNWEVIQPYIGYTPINVANRVTEVTPSAINFPTNDAVIAYLSTQLSALIGTLSEPSATKYVAVNELVAALAAKADTNTITALLNGFAFKTTPCRVATTENITLDGLQTIDELLISEDDSVLVWQQTDKTQNGIYLAKDGAWVRREDADTTLKLKAATVRVTEGTENADQQFTQIHEDVIIGSDDIEFTKSGATAAFATLAGVPGDNAALAAALAGKEATTNKATTFASKNDTLYPTTKAVDDNYDTKLVAIDNIDADFSPVATDLRKWKRFTGTVTRTITLPSDATLALPIGFTFYFSRSNTGAVQWVAGSGATVNAADTATKLRVQYSPAQIVKVAANTWLVLGDISV